MRGLARSPLPPHQTPTQLSGQMAQEISRHERTFQLSHESNPI